MQEPANEVSTDLAWPLPEPLTDPGGDADSAKGRFHIEAEHARNHASRYAARPLLRVIQGGASS